MLTMIEAKALGLKAAGQEFECVFTFGERAGQATGCVGTILPELSARGKLQAVLTCATPGCNLTHVREVSDWHQSRFCEVHGKKSKHSAGGHITYGKQVKLDDGTVIKEMKVLETDDEELRSMKLENNQIFAELLAVQEAKDAQVKADAKALRDAENAKAQLVKAQAARDAAKAQARASLELAKKMSAERGVAVSPKLIAEAGEESPKLIAEAGEES